MLSRFAAAALVAGLIAGVCVSAIQAVTTTPLILEAEKFEGKTNEAPSTSASDAPHAHSHGDHSHGDSDAMPGDGLQRTLYTTGATVGTTFGFALILLAVMTLCDAPISPRSALMWALAGFTVTGLAPALGLSPELPGSAAAELPARQYWWAGTALATGVGLFLLLRVSTTLSIITGVLLIALPHVIGAPHPNVFTSRVPAELSGQFAAASLVVHALTWILTGVIAGYVWNRIDMSARESGAASS